MIVVIGWEKQYIEYSTRDLGSQLDPLNKPHDCGHRLGKQYIEYSTRDLGSTKKLNLIQIRDGIGDKNC